MKILNIKEPNCMIIGNNTIHRISIDEINNCQIGNNINHLTIYKITKNLELYFTKFLTLLRDPVTGLKLYPEYLGIKDCIDNEYFTIIVEQDKQYIEYILAIESIMINPMNKNIVFNIIRKSII